MKNGIFLHITLFSKRETKTLAVSPIGAWSHTLHDATDRALARHFPHLQCDKEFKANEDVTPLPGSTPGSPCHLLLTCLLGYTEHRQDRHSKHTLWLQMTL